MGGTRSRGSRRLWRDGDCPGWRRAGPTASRPGRTRSQYMSRATGTPGERLEARVGPSRRCCGRRFTQCQSPPRKADPGRSPGPTWAVGMVTRTHRPPVFRRLGRHSVEFFAARNPGLAVRALHEEHVLRVPHLAEGGSPRQALRLLEVCEPLALDVPTDWRRRGRRSTSRMYGSGRSWLP